MNLSDLQRLTVKEAYAAYLHAPTNAQKQRAKELMQDPEASATALLVAARHLLGPSFLAYEPETLWLELDPCPINKDKLGAAVALATTPSFYWDYRVFGATVHALNNEMVRPEAVPHCSPAQMAWAVFEAELLFSLTDEESTKPEYDESIAAYVAVSLFEEGHVRPPVGLSFAAEELTARLHPQALTLLKETEAAWDMLPKEPEKLEQTKFEDSPKGAQLRRLTEAWLYVVTQTKHLRSELATL